MSLAEPQPIPQTPARTRRPGAWRVYVEARAQETQADAKRALNRRKGDDGYETLAEIYQALIAHLDTARDYARSPHGLRRWLTGQCMEGAWFNVYCAQVLLISLLPVDELPGRAHEVLATARAYLGADDQRLVRLSARVAAGDVGEQDRTLLEHTLRAAYVGASLETGRVRGFRNLLLGGFLVVSLIVGGLLLVGAFAPQAIPMCGAGGDRTSAVMCPTGKNAPSGGDVALVGLIGLVGAALATAVGLSTQRELSTRYSLAIPQSLLKAPMGVATAIIGVLLLSSGFIPGLGGVSSQAAILVWALVFGYAQQIVTRFVDEKAQTLLKAASPLTPGSTSPTR
ncbi:hypothetical protein [Rhizohabitans arisaemae]|uniref:hypothetical protein n=1 Tax=Rhizohabitans arisaemae TaxID=2720610 RepID=UPI0024B155A6|nr:hypothetical protein [Rhizohabitans arisaemae]